ncbi:MAG TPA: tetratricopeptide repeat protein [Candidatus Limnocylindrales bacterium]|jgi:tetratricopeptide (TPR) repeat protein|nr:tetratricopeptide repeat protein [Candidatus Limnocylindrales bacterium]
MSEDSTLVGRMGVTREISSEEDFVPALLPWLIAAAALLFYLVTLNHWVSFNSIVSVANLSGWTWQPELYGPVYWLLTLPLRLLPAKLIPLAVNLFSAVCAVLTLALLARSVALLPHDRTAQQRMRERSAFALLSIRSAWLPPVLAVLVCGLQLTFWEHATVGSWEMLDLLMFAYVVRCLLEFRVDGRDSWLFRAAFVYGATMTNNWAMIGFFPVWLVALIWIKGANFFDGRFLLRMFLLGTAGMLLYLLLPVVAALSGIQLSVWQLLRANLASQKTYLSMMLLSKSQLFQGERPLWVLALPSLLPVLALSIRWPSYFGDISKLGVTLATWVFHFLHAVLLVLCVWVALDPQFSPRHYQPAMMSYGLLLLPFYYLGALSVGYFSGYFLLVFGVKPTGRLRFVPHSSPLISNTMCGLVWALLLLAPGLLLWRNLPQIRITNGPMLQQFATLLTRSLPSNGALVLSDDLGHLLLAQSACTQSGKSKDFVFLDSNSLTVPEYYSFLHRKYPQKWQTRVPTGVQEIPDADVQFLLSKLSETNEVYYLHPSFGYYFEIFYPEAHGLLYKLQRYSTNTPLGLPPGQQQIAENENFWKQIDGPILDFIQSASRKPVPPTQHGLWQGVIKPALVADEGNHDATSLGRYYSLALDYWGVKMQRSGHLAEAARLFQRAIDLHPNNVVAAVNGEFNRNLQAGKKASVHVSKSVQDEFGKYRTWDAVMRENGPFDEPSLCYQQGKVFFEGGNYTQAAHEFLRVRELAPDNVPARLSLIEACLLRHRVDEALRQIEDIHANEPSLTLSSTNQTELLVAEVAARLAKKDLPGAEKAVDTVTSKFPNDTDVLGAATKVFMDFRCYTNALEMTDRHLKINPDNPGVLFNRGCALVQMGQFAPAIESLSRVVDMGTNNPTELYELARFVRGRAYLGSDKLDEAETDFQILQKSHPDAFQPYYGLGEVAYHRRDTNAALANYQRALDNTPTNSPDAKSIIERLRDLRPGTF